jgi:hypothetical protein
MSLNNFLGHGRGVLQVQYPSAAIAKTKQLAVSSAFTKVHVGRFVDPKTIRFTFVNVRVREAPQGRDIEGIVFVFSDRARGAADAQDRLFPSLTPREISYMAWKIAVFLFSVFFQLLRNAVRSLVVVL